MSEATSVLLDFSLLSSSHCDLAAPWPAAGSRVSGLHLLYCGPHSVTPPWLRTPSGTWPLVPRAPTQCSEKMEGEPGRPHGVTSPEPWARRQEVGPREVERLVKVTQPRSAVSVLQAPRPHLRRPPYQRPADVPRGPGSAIASGQRLTLEHSRFSLRLHQNPGFLQSCDPEKPHLRSTKGPACSGVTST